MDPVMLVARENKRKKINDDNISHFHLIHVVFKGEKINGHFSIIVCRQLVQFFYSVNSCPNKIKGRC